MPEKEKFLKKAERAACWDAKEFNDLNNYF